MKTLNKSTATTIFGQSVGAELERMSPRQQIFAERIISEVLCQGKLGNLTENSHFEPSYKKTCNIQNPRNTSTPEAMNDYHHRNSSFSPWTQCSPPDTDPINTPTIPSLPFHHSTTHQNFHNFSEYPPYNYGSEHNYTP